MKDLSEFIAENRQRSLVVRSIAWDAKFRVRACAWQGFLDGAFTFKELMKFMIPRMHSSRKLLEKYHIYINHVFEQLLLQYGDGSSALYGHPFFFYPGNWAEGFEFIGQIVFHDQYQVKNFLKPDSVVIDAGANIGAFSISAARLATDGFVYAFEPATDVYQILRKNLANYPNVATFHSGLGEKKTERTMLYMGGGGGGNTFEDSLPDSWRMDILTMAQGRENIAVITIDSLVAGNNIKKVDFIKIDTEGYETNILEGARETIQRWKPVIAMSAYHRPGDKDKLPKLLQSISPEYTCRLHKQGDEDFICIVI